jgi:hypothetical protein
MPELPELLRRRVSAEAITTQLGSLDHGERVEALSRLGRDDQRLLYAAAADCEPLDLDFFAPVGAPPSVRHYGTNTLPLPRRLRQFEKRFARPSGGEERLFGYNEWALRRLIGPGYFVARSTADSPDWRERGDVVVDYFEVPDDEVPSGWPDVAPNSRGLQRFVYGGTRDFLRRVSDDVSIGAAFRGEKALDHYFTLCRAVVSV